MSYTLAYTLSFDSLTILKSLCPSTAAAWLILFSSSSLKLIPTSASGIVIALDGVVSISGLE